MNAPKDYYLKQSVQSADGDRIIRREISEMLGICRGIIADGVVAVEEVKLLEKWLQAHPLAASAFPGSAIAARLFRVYRDGVVTDEERSDLLALLQDATGQKDLESVTAPTSLPLDVPPPEIIFQGMTFCFTGKFASGSRDWCKSETHARGGVCLDGVNKNLRFLVIGTVGSDRWAHSSFGNKIEKAVSLKNGGLPLAIISEEHWQKKLAR